MSPVINQLRRLSLNVHKERPATNKRKKSLSVKISKDPPVIHKFEQDKLEATFEYIFDPLVRHDDEFDHPELLYDDGKKRISKAWEIPGYVHEQQSSNMTTVLKRLTTWSPKHGGKTMAPTVSPV